MLLGDHGVISPPLRGKAEPPPPPPPPPPLPPSHSVRDSKHKERKGCCDYTYVHLFSGLVHKKLPFFKSNLH